MGFAVKIPIRLIELGAALLVLNGHTELLGQQPAKLAPEVIRAWQKAGADFGWAKPRSDTPFDSSRWVNDVLTPKHPVPNYLPTFSARSGAFAFQKLNKLDEPEASFGLMLEGTDVTDDVLKELTQ